MATEAVLDMIGVLENTDKSSSGHGYLQYYEEILRPLRQERFTLLEIGVAGGGSLRTWKTYFPHAQIIGLDINPDCKAYEEERIRIEIGSQDDPALLDRIVANDPPLIVVDDGSHMAHHMITTFERLFPALLPGGYYFFEDAYMHYGTYEADHIGLARLPLKDYCANLATSRTRGWLHTSENHGISKYIFEHTASIAYIWRAILIRKCFLPVEDDTALRTAERIASETGLGRHWLGVAKLALAGKDNATLAETAARRAMQAGLVDWQAPYHLVTALQQQGRIDDAMAEAEQALLSYPRAVKLLEWIGLTWGRRGDHARAASYFQRALIFDPMQMWFHLSLSRCHLELGEMEQALEAARQADQLAEGSPHAEVFKAHRIRVEATAAAASGDHC